MDPAAKKRRLEELPELEPRTYSVQRILGKGSYGVVYQAQIVETGEVVAIKAIRMQASGDGWKQLTGDKEREVQILKELEGHPNVVNLRGAFLSHVEGGKESRLNLVLEFLSDTLHRVLKHHNKLHQQIAPYYVKLYSYQVVRGLAFVHGRGIVHCDLKPQNLLLDGRSHTLKICDFGTAKRLCFNKKATTCYVCSRYYRAPELILGSMCYTTAVDLWSAGCVYAEMFLGQPLFTGSDGIDQLVEIIKVLGTPTKQELQAMNPNYPEYEFQPRVRPISWDKVFRGWTTPDVNELAGMMLRFDPAGRSPPLQLLAHRYFDQLRGDDRPSHRTLFDFKPEELWWCSARDKEKLVPRWMSAQLKQEVAT